jgi:pimeloyl-ACP methyl ester carboxylesterase
MAIAIAELFPEKVRSLVLLAPDCIQLSPWYTLATGNRFGKKIFRHVITHPAYWGALISLADRSGLLPSKLLRFADSQMNSEEKRWKLYHTWMLFREFKFDLDRFCESIIKHKIAFRVLVGARDVIIPPARVEKLRKHLPGFSPVILDSGHTGMINTSMEYLQEMKK